MKFPINSDFLKFYFIIVTKGLDYYKMSHFKLILSTKANDVIPINKYVSEKTGITVIIAGVEGPVVNGFFCLGEYRIFNRT